MLIILGLISHKLYKMRLQIEENISVQNLNEGQIQQAQNNQTIVFHKKLPKDA